MNYFEPTLLVISGPNGAGKSTHIQAMLPEDLEGILSFDRDLTRSVFEEQLTAQGVSLDLIPQKATRLMEEKLHEQIRATIQQKSHFVLETPLSHEIRV